MNENSSRALALKETKIAWSYYLKQLQIEDFASDYQ